MNHQIDIYRLKRTLDDLNGAVICECSPSPAALEVAQMIILGAYQKIKERQPYTLEPKLATTLEQRILQWMQTTLFWFDESEDDGAKEFFERAHGETSVKALALASACYHALTDGDTSTEPTPQVYIDLAFVAAENYFKEKAAQ